MVSSCTCLYRWLLSDVFRRCRWFPVVTSGSGGTGRHRVVLAVTGGASGAPGYYSSQGFRFSLLSRVIARRIFVTATCVRLLPFLTSALVSTIKYSRISF